MQINTPAATWQFLNDIDLICFSHLRWNFVYQRPQHLLSRFANYTRVFYYEEPVFHDAPDKLHINKETENIYVILRIYSMVKPMMNYLINKKNYLQTLYQ
jgi:hypothetical protein